MFLPPPHPILVHLPAALLPVALFLDVLGLLTRREGFHTAAGWNLLIGAVGSAGAAVTGLLAGEKAEELLAETTGPAAGILEVHEILGITVAVLAVLLAVWRLFARLNLPLKLRTVHLAGLGVLCGVLLFGAHLGGRLVFEFGVGTPCGPQSSAPASRPVGGPTQPPGMP